MTCDNAGMRVISLDCETNGLGGQAFAAAAVLTDDDGREVGRWEARCPIAGPVNDWVAANVLPAIEGLPETHGSYGDLLAAWRDWYGERRDGTAVIGHVVWPVEAKFLRDAHADDLFAGPYPLIDVAPMLLLAGLDPTSVDGCLDRWGLGKPDGSPHHPLYDARAAATAFYAVGKWVRRSRMGIPTGVAS